MTPIVLMDKLRDIELALATEDISVARKLVAEALQCAVQMQRESPEQRRRDSRVIVHL